MREHCGVERVEFRIVDIRYDNALAQVIQAYGQRRAAEVRKRILMQPAPYFLRRFRNDHAIRMAAVSQRHDEQARLAIFAGVRIERRRALAP